MKTKILIIEDNVLTLDELEYRVSEMGYDVDTAVSANEAIRKVKTFNPDLILSDINLGEGIDGIDTIKQINKDKNIPVIYITAYDDNNTLKRAEITEPYAYILKPVRERELNIAINIALYKSKTETELRELNQMKNKFFSIIAHDLLNPISSVTMISNGLNDQFDILDKEKAKHYIKILNQGLTRVNSFVKSLLNWSRSQMDGIVVTKTDTHLPEFVKNIAAQFHDSLKNKGITISYEIDNNQKVLIDSNIIEVVLRNLLSNAIKFTRKGGTITVKSEPDQNTKKTKVSVIDNGIGIPKIKLEELFRIDKKVNTLGTDEERGNGLGLIICKEFIEKHGSTIHIESEPDKGSTFSFELELA